MDKIVV